MLLQDFAELSATQEYMEGVELELYWGSNNEFWLHHKRCFLGLNPSFFLSFEHQLALILQSSMQIDPKAGFCIDDYRSTVRKDHQF